MSERFGIQRTIFIPTTAFGNNAQRDLGHLSDFFIQRHIADQLINLLVDILRLCMQVSMETKEQEGGWQSFE